MRILVVDDSAFMRTLLEQQLLKAGHTVRAIEPVSLFAVLAALREERPGLLVTDYEMPACNGDDLVRAVREDPVLKALPILMVSAHGEAEVRERLERWGGCDFIHKPVDGADLLRKVDLLGSGVSAP